MLIGNESGCLGETSAILLLIGGIYTDLSEKNIDSNLKKLFLKLASEEAQHKLVFEKLYDDEILEQD